MGARPHNTCSHQKYWRISIHAPAWGATIAGLSNAARYSHFNPRARVGRDFGDGFWWQVFGDFNPRARVGRDDEDEKFLAELADFNPRARMGARQLRVP